MKIIAHRGSSGIKVENTLAAFEQAIIDNADGIELDIQYHPSGELFLLHDIYLNIGGTYQHLSELTVEEIQAITHEDGSKIATLDQAFALINGQCHMNIEVKSASVFPHHQPDGYVVEIITLLKKHIEQAVTMHNFTWQQICISSFNHPLLAQIKKQMPLISIGLLTASCYQHYAHLAQNLQVQTVNLAVDCITQTFVDEAKNNGVEVWVYTVNHTADLELCFHLGVDAIFTDFPLESREYITQLKLSKLS